MVMIMVMIMIVVMIMTVIVTVPTQPSCPLDQQGSPNPYDCDARDRRQDRSQRLGRDVFSQKQCHESEKKHTDGMGKRHHAAEKRGVLVGSPRAHQVSRDDRLAVAGRK